MGNRSKETKDMLVEVCGSQKYLRQLVMVTGNIPSTTQQLISYASQDKYNRNIIRLFKLGLLSSK